MPDRLGWIGLAVAVIAGLLVGFASTTVLYRYRVLRVPGEPILQRLDRELHLTPPERRQIHQIIRETHGKVRERRRRTHNEFRHERQELFREAYGRVRAVLALGRIAFDRYLSVIREQVDLPPRSRMPFAHGASYALPGGLPRLFASYHPSQQNTQTGKLTHAMMHQVLTDINIYLRSAG